MLMLLFIFSAPVGAAQYDGELTWYRRVELSTPVSGVVAQAPVNPGDRVKSGDSLLSLDDRFFQAELMKAKLEVERRAQLEAEAKRELDRNQELYERTLLSDHTLEMAKIGYTDAQAHLQAANAALAKAQMDVQYSHIRAPFDGVVIARLAEIGQTIVSENAAAPLIILAQTGVMAAKTLVSFSQASKLKVGQKAGVLVAGRSYPGHVKHVSLEPVAGKTKRYEVVVAFEVKEKLFRVGQAVKVELP